jgi:large subunit ribosomal protein L9
MGDVVSVKNGYARNYLIPQGKALRATNENKAEFEARKDEIAKQNAAKLTEAEKFAKQIEGTIVELVRQASDDGRLYGSVTVRDIGQFLEEKGFAIPRQNLLLGAAIKEIGEYKVKVMPHPEVELELPVRIARTESEFGSWEEDRAKAAEEEARAAAASEEATAKALAAAAAAEAAAQAEAEEAEAGEAETTEEDTSTAA